MFYYQLKGFRFTGMIKYSYWSWSTMQNTFISTQLSTSSSPFRCSHWKCSVRKSVLRNFTKFRRKRLCQSLFFTPPMAPSPIHKISRILLIFIQMLVKVFVSNIIIDLLYNLNKYIQYKYVWKLLKVGCLHQHTVIALHCLDRNEKLLEIFA